MVMKIKTIKNVHEEKDCCKNKYYVSIVNGILLKT